MRWSWETTARYLFQDKKFVLTIPLNRYVIPVIRSVEFNPLSNSISIVGYMDKEYDRPIKMEKPITFSVHPEMNPLVECEKELR